MTTGQAVDFGWVIAGPVVVFVMFVAVFLLGFSLLREIGR